MATKNMTWPNSTTNLKLLQFIGIEITTILANSKLALALALTRTT